MAHLTSLAEYDYRASSAWRLYAIGLLHHGPTCCCQRQLVPVMIGDLGQISRITVSYYSYFTLKCS